MERSSNLCLNYCSLITKRLDFGTSVLSEYVKIDETDIGYIFIILWLFLTFPNVYPPWNILNKTEFLLEGESTSELLGASKKKKIAGIISSLNVLNFNVVSNHERENFEPT